MKNFRILLTVLIFLSCFNLHLIAKPVIQIVQGNKAEALLQNGLTLSQLGRYLEAISVLEKASWMMPGDPKPYTLIGAVYEMQSKYKSASEVYAKAIRLDNQDKKIYIKKANVDFYRNALDDSIATCRQVLQLDPNFAEAYFVLGRSLSAAAKPKSEVSAAYQSAIKADPGFLAPYVPLGVLLLSAKNVKGAEAIYRKGISADPQKMTGRFQLGHLLIEQGRLVEARELWKDATSDVEEELKYHLGTLEYAENLKRTKDFLAKKPNNPDALVQVGLAMIGGEHSVIDKRQEQAIVYFNQALKLKPGFAKAQYGVCKAYIQLASLYSSKQKLADQELAKMRKMDAAMADELEDYRKNFDNGLPRGTVRSPADLNK